MTSTMTNDAPAMAGLAVRALRESDLPAADAVLRSAFDAFTGVSGLFGDWG
jgi:hypothetical protein